MANALNEFFITAAISIVDQIPPTDKPPDPDPEPEIYHPLFSFTNSPVTRSEVSEVIKRQKNSGLLWHFH